MKKITLLLLLFILISCQSRVNNLPFPVMALLNSEQNKFDSTLAADFQKAGFNMLTLPYRGVEQNKIWLALADSFDLKLVLSDQRIDQFMQNPQMNNILDSMIMDYSSHPSFYGYYTFDKPDSNMYSLLANSVRYLNTQDPEHPAIVNMLPLHRQKDVNGLNYFYRDLWALVDRVSPNLICFEQFPVFTTDTEYFQNLEILKSVCEKQNITWWATLTQTHHFSSAVEKSLLDVQYFSVLAYGAKGLAYYMNDLEQQPDDSPEFNKPKDPFKHFVRLNRITRSLTPLLYDLKPVGVFHTDPVPRGCISLKAGLPLLNVDGKQFLIGMYKNNKSYWIWVVNKNVSSGARCRFTFGKHVKTLRQIQMDHLEGQTIDMIRKKHRCELVFKAGEGRLFEMIIEE